MALDVDFLHVHYGDVKMREGRLRGNQFGLHILYNWKFILTILTATFQSSFPCLIDFYCINTLVGIQ